jgi:methionine-rich copper-binding protein CopC
MMRLNRQFLAAFALSVAAAISLMVETVQAHAVLLESNPSLKGEVAGPDVSTPNVPG